jgi:hypothetical protein
MMDVYKHFSLVKLLIYFSFRFIFLKYPMRAVRSCEYDTQLHHNRDPSSLITHHKAPIDIRRRHNATQPNPTRSQHKTHLTRPHKRIHHYPLLSIQLLNKVFRRSSRVCSSFIPFPFLAACVVNADLMERILIVVYDRRHRKTMDPWRSRIGRNAHTNALLLLLSAERDSSVLSSNFYNNYLAHDLSQRMDYIDLETSRNFALSCVCFSHYITHFFISISIL